MSKKLQKLKIILCCAIFVVIICDKVNCTPWSNRTREHLFGRCGLCYTIAGCQDQTHSNIGIHTEDFPCNNHQHCGREHLRFNNHNLNSLNANGANHYHIVGFCNIAHCHNPNHVTIGQHANASIQDEGFRWRNTFNFNLQNHQGNALNIQNWQFNQIIEWNSLRQPEVFSQNLAYLENNNQGQRSNGIHRHLANIVHNVNKIHRWNCVSVSAAAVTIVVENPQGTFNAYSRVITTLGNNVYVSKINTPIKQSVRDAINAAPQAMRAPALEALNVNDQQNNIFSYINIANIASLNEFLDCNLIVGDYGCTEGKILSAILDNTRLRWNIDQLLTHAGQNGHPENIRLIVLHIGTSMDPCARCVRCLAGLSRRINYGNNFDVLDNPRGLNNFNGINAKFLIEVSSGGHYLTTTQEVDNFARYGYGLCSHTECAGHDGQEGAAINIRLRDSGIPVLAPPNPLPAAFVAPQIAGVGVLKYVAPAVHANSFVPVVFAVDDANAAQVNTAAQTLFDQIRVMLAAHITVADARERLAPMLNAFVVAGAVPAGNLADAINAFTANTNQANAQSVLNLFYGGIYNLQPIVEGNHQDFANNVMNGLILLADDVARIVEHNADHDNMLGTIVARLIAFRDAGLVYPNGDEVAGSAEYATFLGAATAVNAQAFADALHTGEPVVQAHAVVPAILFIPNGTNAGWEFDHSFPPYIILGRTESAPDEIRAPVYDGLIRYTCGTIQDIAPNQRQHRGDAQVHTATAARNHNCRVDLPQVH
ncbi:MAG: hypothetical protein LBS23_03635 [Holosporaceae bacterium]|nr:hypothetical protein [Holosporaceae bacterium]